VIFCVQPLRRRSAATHDRRSTSPEIGTGTEHFGQRIEIMKIYVGNLSFDTTDDRLREAFSQYGQVQSATLVTDRDTGRPRGFGFVEMGDDGEARAAIAGLNGASLDGRDLKVNEAKPREPRSGGFGGGRDGGGGGGARGRGGARGGRGGW
jgi:cold-inducible RNA-binding protein